MNYNKVKEIREILNNSLNDVREKLKDMDIKETTIRFQVFEEKELIIGGVSQLHK